MNLTMLILSVVPFSKRVPSPPPRYPENGKEYLHLFFDNLSFIEKSCSKVVAEHNLKNRGDIDLENETDELFIEVIDKLTNNDFRVLREFRNTAQITTYLATIISNQHTDIYRRKKGRDRSGERARELGGTAERLYELVYKKGFSFHEAHSELLETYGIREPIEMLEKMLERIRGRTRVFADTGDGDRFLVPAKEVDTEEGVDIVQADPAADPEEIFLTKQSNSEATQIIQELIETLCGEEKSIIALRYPLDDDEIPKSVREIASMLKRTEKAVDNQIRRILTGFREKLLKQGITQDDLL